MTGRQRELATIWRQPIDRLVLDVICIENVPEIAELLSITPEQVREEGLSALGVMAEGGGYICRPDHPIKCDVPPGKRSGPLRCCARRERRLKQGRAPRRRILRSPGPTIGQGAPSRKSGAACAPRTGPGFLVGRRPLRVHGACHREHPVGQLGTGLRQVT